MRSAALGRSLPGVLVALGWGQVENRDSTWGIVLVPVAFRDDGHVAGAELARRIADHGEFGGSGQDQQQFVTGGVTLPGWLTGEASNPARATVKLEITDRAVGLLIDGGNVVADHPVDRVDT